MVQLMVASLRRLALLALVRCAGCAVWSDPRFRVGTVRGPSVAAAAGNDLLGAMLREVFAGRRRPFLAARLSLGAELSIALEYVQNRTLTVTPALRRNAGVYPETAAEAERFARAYAEAAANATVMARFGGAYEAAETAVLAALAPTATVVENRALEPFYFPRSPWSAALEGRRVLVVHPFAATIRRQYERHRRGELLWPGRTLPAFSALTVVRAPVSLGDAAAPHGSWSESLEAAAAAIDAAGPFDVALLGCGSYGLPLADRVRSRGSPAVLVGGGLQLLFGIKGRRWTDRPDFVERINGNWVWPRNDETPPGARAVEGGAYWK